MRWSLDKKQSARESAQQAHAEKRKKYAAGGGSTVTIGTATDSGANPERQRVGGIRGDGRNSSEQERGEGDKTSAAGNCVHGSAKRAGEEQQDGMGKAQANLLSRKSNVAPDRFSGISDGRFRSRRVAEVRKDWCSIVLAIGSLLTCLSQ